MLSVFYIVNFVFLKISHICDIIKNKKENNYEKKKIITSCISNDTIWLQQPQQVLFQIHKFMCMQQKIQQLKNWLIPVFLDFIINMINMAMSNVQPIRLTYIHLMMRQSKTLELWQKRFIWKTSMINFTKNSNGN